MDYDTRIIFYEIIHSVPVTQRKTKKQGVTESCVPSLLDNPDFRYPSSI